jgi:hypothetical protein
VSHENRRLSLNAEEHQRTRRRKEKIPAAEINERTNSSLANQTRKHEHHKTAHLQIRQGNMNITQRIKRTEFLLQIKQGYIKSMKVTVLPPSFLIGIKIGYCHTSILDTTKMKLGSDNEPHPL